jgi:hypothetical protein
VGRERARWRRPPASAPGPLSRMNSIDGPSRPNRSRGRGIRRISRWRRCHCNSDRSRLCSGGRSPSSSPSTGPPPGGEVQRRQRDCPVGDDAVRHERTDDQADPEQRDQKPKHGSPFVRVFRGHRKCPRGDPRGHRREQETNASSVQISNLRGQVSWKPGSGSGRGHARGCADEASMARLANQFLGRTAERRELQRELRELWTNANVD